MENQKRNLTLLKLALFVLCIQITACNNEAEMKKYFSELLKDVDKVQIQFFAGDYTLVQTITEQDSINIYKEIINGKQEQDLKCDSTGRIHYYRKGRLRLEAYFSTPSTRSRYDTPVVVYFFKPDIYKTRFTYRAGMGIDERFYQIKRKK
jgi:hypothetical protein